MSSPEVEKKRELVIGKPFDKEVTHSSRSEDCEYTHTVVRVRSCDEFGHRWPHPIITVPRKGSVGLFLQKAVLFNIRFCFE